MADFCTQCAIEIFGEDVGDLADLSTPAETADGFFPYAICEGCGVIQVDHTGKCVSPNCTKHKDAPTC